MSLTFPSTQQSSKNLLNRLLLEDVIPEELHAPKPT